jgi:protease-4
VVIIFPAAQIAFLQVLQPSPGSIGVFGIIPNMEGFFKNKLGVTFDGVKTAPYADLGAIYRPMNENEKKFVQQSIDEIYLGFKQRVADGRKKSVDDVDSIAQGEYGVATGQLVSVDR